MPDQRKPIVSQNSARSLMQAEKLMQIAVLLPASACVGWLIGAWADRRLHQSWIGLVGILLGGILGLIYVIRLVMANQGSSASTASQSKEEEPKTRE